MKQLIASTKHEFVGSPQETAAGSVKDSSVSAENVLYSEQLARELENSILSCNRARSPPPVESDRADVESLEAVAISNMRLDDGGGEADMKPSPESDVAGAFDQLLRVAPTDGIQEGGWEYNDITKRLDLIPPVTEKEVKEAIKMDKDGHATPWVSQGSIRAWCTQCTELPRHKMLVLRYRASTDGGCTLQAKYLHCPVSGSVFYGTTGQAGDGAAGRGRRGITLAVKMVIDAMVAEHRNPLIISEYLKARLGDGAPTLRQVQNYVFRLKKKKRARSTVEA